MGKSVTLSPMGLYNWDDTIFDLMLIPEALDRDTLIENILIETAELEVVYPNPVVFKNLLGVWSAKQVDIWSRLYATPQYEYNPIENYDRHEEGSTSGTDTTLHSGSDTRTIDKDTGGRDSVGGTAENDHFIAGFNSQAVGDNDGLVKQTRDNAEQESTTIYGRTEDVTDTLAHGERIAIANDGEHELYAHGNIGVTSSQELIQQQREVETYNIYDIIIQDFKAKFCIMIY